MTSKALTKRIERIEARRPAVTYPPYLSVATVEDIPAALEGWPAEAARGVKIFVGISPDDWDKAEP